MIVETVFQWACNLIVGLFSIFEFINLPLDIISSLYSIVCYGTWCVGADVLALFSASVMGWMLFKSSTGLAIWLYKLLPLT